MRKIILAAALAALSIGSARACERLILYANIANGKIFEMVDSSKWIVIDPGIAFTPNWGSGDEIEACDDGTLSNVDTDEEVKAKRVK
jgi:hypothetical protein